MHLRKNYTKNVDLKQRRKGGGFEDLLVSIKFWIIKHQLIFTVYFSHQIGIIIRLTISKLDRFSAEQKVLVILFLPQEIRERNKLDASICEAPLYSVFRKSTFRLIQPTANSIFGTNHVSGVQLLTRLRVGFSYLKKHKFKHNF